MMKMKTTHDELVDAEDAMVFDHQPLDSAALTHAIC